MLRRRGREKISESGSGAGCCVGVAWNDDGGGKLARELHHLHWISKDQVGNWEGNAIQGLSEDSFAYGCGAERCIARRREQDMWNQVNY